MENDDIINDDFLRELIQRTPLDSPSDDFVDRVMAGIQTSAVVPEVKKPFYLYLKAALPYAAIALFLFVVMATSDLPIFNWIPGKDHLISNLITFSGTLFTILKNSFASKFVSWGLLISFSAGMLVLIDQLFSRRTSL